MWCHIFALGRVKADAAQALQTAKMWHYWKVLNSPNQYQNHLRPLLSSAPKVLCDDTVSNYIETAFIFLKKMLH